MIEAALSGFWAPVAWPAFGYMLIGIAIGFWVGLLPGLGGLFTFAIQQRDVPLIQATIFVIAALFALANLVADVMYTYLDPRIRFAPAQ